MRKFLLVCALAQASFTAPSFAQSLIFSDDFNRPDAPVVGNGWLDLSTNGQPFQLLNGEAIFPYADAAAAIFRPLQFSQPLLISATLSDVSGFGGVPYRHGSSIAILDQYSLSGTGGYRLAFSRGDANYSDSKVILWDQGAEVGVAYSSFQFASSLTVAALFNLDGSIQGTVSDGANSFAFAFGSYSPSANGDYLSLTSTGGPDGRSTTFIYQRFDNLTVTAIPEPAATSLIVVAGSVLAAFLRLRRRGLQNESASHATA